MPMAITSRIKKMVPSFKKVLFPERLYRKIREYIAVTRNKNPMTRKNPSQHLRVTDV
jgi:hypothetical protein